MGLHRPARPLVHSASLAQVLTTPDSVLGFPGGAAGHVRGEAVVAVPPPGALARVHDASTMAKTIEEVTARASTDTTLQGAVAARDVQGRRPRACYA